MSSKSFNNATTLNTPDLVAKINSATLAEFELIPNLQYAYTVKQFGATGDGSTPDDTAIATAVAAAISDGKPLYFPPGTYKLAATGTTVWDLKNAVKKGVKFFGAGIGRTVLNFTGITAGIALQIGSTTTPTPADSYDFSLADMSITGSFVGVLVCVGYNDFRDPLNCLNFTGVGVFNSINNSSAVALRLNYVVNSNFIGCRANCFANGAGTNAGTSLECRQAAFNTFTNGSYGNAYYGVRFKDGYSYGNVFLGCDIENINYGVTIDSSSAGNNTFIGGQWSYWIGAGVLSNGSLSTNAVTIVNPNNGGEPLTPPYNGAKFIDQTNFGGIRLIDGTPVSTPTLPASGTTVRNITGKRILVTFWGGTVTQATVQGFGIGIATGSVVVQHGQTISLTYTGSPTWLWQPLE
jgi:hypothetical protein